MEYEFLYETDDSESDYSTANESVSSEYQTADEFDDYLGDFLEEFRYSVSPDGTVWILPVTHDYILL